MSKPKSQRHFKTPRCTKRSCVLPALMDGLCRKHAKAAADRQWSEEIVADHQFTDRCELAERHPSFPCSGPLQAAHGFSRRYGKVRHNSLNGFALCQAAHVYWTHRPLEWDEILRAEWGEHAYNELRRLALS